MYFYIKIQLNILDQHWPENAIIPGLYKLQQFQYNMCSQEKKIYWANNVIICQAKLRPHISLRGQQKKKNWKRRNGEERILAINITIFQNSCSHSSLCEQRKRKLLKKKCNNLDSVTNRPHSSLCGQWKQIYLKINVAPRTSKIIVFTVLCADKFSQQRYYKI